MIQAYEHKVLLNPTSVTGSGVTGSWVDMVGLDHEHGVKVVQFVGAGTTPGTATGYVQASSDTAGSDAATVATFDGLTSAGGSSAKNFNTVKRYARFVGDTQTNKDMLHSVVLIAQARYTP